MATNLQPGQALLINQYYRIRPSPGKGNGAFAIRNIKAGTKILIEEPLFTIPKPQDHITPIDVATIYSSLQPAERALFDSLPILFHPGHSPLEDLCTKFGGSAFEAVDGRSTSCCVHASRFNHSCRPNCAIKANPQNQREGLVIRDVANGEELTFSYDEHLGFMTTAQRKAISEGIVGRKCACELCTAAAQVVSDLRRNMMRHLYFVIKNVDMARGPVPPIDPDFRHELLKIGQEREFCCHSYHWLLIQLAEAEGLIGKPRFAALYVEMLGVRLRIAENEGEEELDEDSLEDVKVWLAKIAEMRWMFDSAQMLCQPKERAKLRKVCRQARRVVRRDGRLS